MKTSAPVVALELRGAAIGTTKVARKAVTLAGVASLLGLVVWSAILTKESRHNARPLVEVSTTLSPETTLSAAHLEGVREVGADEELALEEPADIAETAPVKVEVQDELQKLCTDASVRWFNGRPVKPARVITMTVTAYSPDARSCGESADGITATLHSVATNNSRLVAADPKLLPYGSMLSIAGYADDQIVPVLDCGGKIKGRHIDLLFPEHEQARNWGVKTMKVIVWQYADGKPADNPRKTR